MSKKKSEPENEAPKLENNLELKTMSRAERRLEKKERFAELTEGMTKKEKFVYMVTYYKGYVLIPFCIIMFVVCLSVTIYNNKRPIALAYAILNVSSTNEIDKGFEKDYLEYNGYSSKYRYESSTNMQINYEKFVENREYFETSNASDYYIFSKSCEYGDYDVIITNMDGLLYCVNEDVCVRLSQAFDKNALLKLAPYSYKMEVYEGYEAEYAIDISGTDFAKSLNLGYDDVYLAFPNASEQNKTNSVRLLEYLLGIKLTT